MVVLIVWSLVLFLSLFFSLSLALSLFSFFVCILCNQFRSFDTNTIILVSFFYVTYEWRITHYCITNNVNAFPSFLSLRLTAYKNLKMFVWKQQEIYSLWNFNLKNLKNLVNNRKQSDSKALMMKEQTLIDFFNQPEMVKAFSLSIERKRALICFSP